ncbi:MAG: cytochrome c biogenesis protein CcsA [Pyrinomonadaceae bacterium]
MSQVLTANDIRESGINSSWTNFLPAGLAVFGALVMMFLRLEIGAKFIADESLMMLALACYILAALLQLTNLYAPSEMSRKIGLWSAGLGVFFNLSSWLVRWVAAFDREIGMLRAGGHTETPWFFRYIPFANLYDLSLAFAFGAGIVTLLVANRRNFQFLSAFTLPLAAIILTLARFIGGEFIDLPPVLDSYWRPIHVGTASLSYGVALVCFAVAVIYLLKDKVKPEAMAIWASLFALLVIGTISKFSVLTEAVYRAGIFVPNGAAAKPILTPFRLDIPYVGALLALAAALCVGVIVLFLMYLYQNNEAAKKVGHILLKLSLVVQLFAIGFLVVGIKSATDVYPKLQAQLANNPSQTIKAGRAIAEKQQLSAEQLAQIQPAQLQQAANQYLQNAGSQMFLNLNTNPVELAGLITAFAGLLFVALFSFRTEKLRERLPSLESLDNLMYKTACLAFAGLAMLLITGAIWANESWGRPWGFDSKETGALIAWLTYAAFLHTRISRGWSGRSSAYFAIVGFLLVIFTYLGVSYLLPGLHSYA